MKKIMCNVLYGVNIPVYHKELGHTSLDLGLFADREDAICAGLMTKKILEAENVFDFLSIGNFDVNNEYIPESEMNSQKVSSRFNSDLNSFVTNNTYTNYYLNRHGFTELSILVMDCMGDSVYENPKEEPVTQKGE